MHDSCSVEVPRRYSEVVDARHLFVHFAVSSAVRRHVKAGSFHTSSPQSIGLSRVPEEPLDMFDQAGRSSGSKTSAASPPTSVSAPESAITTGHPDAMASTTGKPKPSQSDL